MPINAGPRLKKIGDWVFPFHLFVNIAGSNRDPRQIDRKIPHSTRGSELIIDHMSKQWIFLSIKVTGGCRHADCLKCGLSATAMTQLG